jgi:ABC-type uncharacterized transport system involved in gliding motility auxiliary subunit
MQHGSSTLLLTVVVVALRRSSAICPTDLSLDLTELLLYTAEDDEAPAKSKH